MALWPQNQGIAKSPTGIEDVRARYGALFQRFGAPPIAMDFTPGQLGPIGGEWVGAGERGRLMLYFPGGGFVAGSPETSVPSASNTVWRRTVFSPPRCATA